MCGDGGQKRTHTYTVRYKTNLLLFKRIQKSRASGIFCQTNKEKTKTEQSVQKKNGFDEPLNAR